MKKHLMDIETKTSKEICNVIFETDNLMKMSVTMLGSGKVKSSASDLVLNASGLVRDASGLVRDASGLVRDASGLVREDETADLYSTLAKETRYLSRKTSELSLYFRRLLNSAQTGDVDILVADSSDLIRDSSDLVRYISGIIKETSGLVKNAELERKIRILIEESGDHNKKADILEKKADIVNDKKSALVLIRDASGLVRDASGLVRDASGLVRDASGLVKEGAPSRGKSHKEKSKSKNEGFSALHPPQPHTITRFPDVSMRDKVVLNVPCTLRIAVTKKPVRKEVESKGMIIEALEEDTSIDVLVTAEGFKIRGRDYRPLVVPAEEDSIPIVFEMVPISLGEKKVKVEFFQKSRYIGGLTARTIVVMPAEEIGARHVEIEGIIGIERSALSPDLTILITESKSDNDHMKYTFRLHAPKQGLFYYLIREELSFSGSPSKWVEGLCEELGKLGRNADPEDINETLITIGTDLYEKLFPSELKQIWETHIRGKIRSIIILSDEPWIPWEVIKPYYKSDTGEYIEDGFLCEDYSLTRWIAGTTPPSFIKISQGVLIAPVVSELPNVKREIDFLKTSFTNTKEINPTLSIVRKLLKEGGFHLMHFACHGSFDPEEHEQSIVYLQGNDILRSRDISGERRNFGKDKPFVFINACETANADFSLVGIGSWAYKFITAHSSGFLGSSWEVNDRLACLFSISFYDGLRRGKTLGDAMRDARLKIRSIPDPTWLAYALYADPNAKMIFE